MLSVGVNSKNQISNSGFVDDAAGNLTADGLLTMTYDAENRMVSVNGGGGSNPEYTYDADGKRIRKKLGSIVTEYLNNAAGQVVAERQGSTCTKGYVYFLSLQPFLDVMTAVPPEL
jgi:YD repeat-containing protein